MISPNIHPRRMARERVLEALFAYEYNHDKPSVVINRIIENHSSIKENLKFINALFDIVVNNKDFTDQMIQSHLQNWEFDRIAQIDRILIKMGICEMFYIEEIPPKVSITEMVEIAKIYSTDDSPVFINGILDAIYKEYQKKEEE